MLGILPAATSGSVTFSIFILQSGHSDLTVF